MKRMPFSLSARVRRVVSGIVRVAAVDQDVARLEQRDELVDHLIDRRRRP